MISWPLGILYSILLYVFFSGWYAHLTNFKKFNIIFCLFSFKILKIKVAVYCLCCVWYLLTVPPLHYVTRVCRSLGSEHWRSFQINIAWKFWQSRHYSVWIILQFTENHNSISLEILITYYAEKSYYVYPIMIWCTVT